MPFALNFFHDQIVAGGSSAPALPAAHRLLYVRYGRAVINGQTLDIDEATYCEGPVILQSAADWSQVWRWELAVPNSTRLLLDGSGVLSSLRMSRVITHLAMLDGSRWLFRLDQIIGAASHRRSSPASRPRNSLPAGRNFQRRAGRGIGSQPVPGRRLVGDRTGYSGCLGVAPDGGKVHARHDPSGRMGRQTDRHMAVGRSSGTAPGPLEALP